ncbi:hypothetical protein ACFRAO_40325 [Streptomyces sp. NPDC056656]|uniref:hypothetical protein n=1 Tax=Streptomyces sp. NPDC056656 TaxID=3345895 RepID=UPI0036C0F305
MNSGLSLGRLSVGSSARTLGSADPTLRWAGAGLYDSGTLAYVTACPAGEDANELGPASEALTGRFA